MSDWQIALIVLSCLTMVVFVVIIVYVYQNRVFLAFTMLKSRNKFKNQRDPDTKMLYDVFICHCREDKHWVLEELVPELEKKDPMIKVCIHERDFDVGETLTDNIVRRIDESRKFMIVLSESFASSKWCMFEIEVAQCRLVNSGNYSNLIVVVKDRVQPTNKTLKVILQTWTYLRYPEDVAKIEDFYYKLKHSILREDRHSHV